MKNLHLIPTEKYSDLVYSTNKYGGLFLSRHYSPMKNMGDSYQNIYITSDEEIKEGDWFLGAINLVYKFTSDDVKNGFKPKGKKIILTTDQELIEVGVQAIDDEFLEWFVKNPSCEEVEVQEFYGFSEDYLIIIPKEEPKQETLGYICPQTKKQCDDECCVSAKDCHLEASMGVLSELKQETLEEVLLKKIETNFSIEINTYAMGLADGANWQAERMYSEEDLREAFRQGMENMDYSEIYGLDSELTEQDWFNQFKKS